MKLTKIKIDNFKSIQSQELEFTENCLGLIGLNESGKSNVLSALRIFEKDHKVEVGDQSKITEKWPKVFCEFSPNEEDLKKIETYLKTFLSSITSINTYSYELSSKMIISKRARALDENGTLKIQITYHYPQLLKVDFPLYKLFNQELPEESTLEINENLIPVASLKLVQKELIKPELEAYFEEYTSDDFEYEFDEWLEITFPKLSPQVIFWEYKDKYLLPSEITYEQFIAGDNPYENSAPLYNIFLLRNALKVKTAQELITKVGRWKKNSSERLKDQAIINSTLNDHIGKIWKGFDQELVIGLEENKITIFINDPNNKEKNFYAMGERSQGFKTFISFILTIAAEAENGIIDNYILLLDEPETHLHPSGVRYMKEELLKLAEGENYIVFSTHSIFMIDRKVLSRHIKVVKEIEVTKLFKIQKNNFIQEAVIFQAMGAIIDEYSFGPFNVIVEGELDLTLFEFYVQLFEVKDLHKSFKSATVYNGGGTKEITTFLKSRLLPKDSVWNVILDNDAAGKSLAKFIKESVKDYPFAKVTSHSYSSVKDFELEDILPRTIIKSALDKTLIELNLKNTLGLDFGDEKKVVSLLTNEFIAGCDKPDEIKTPFEISFKTQTSIIVREILNKINEEATLALKIAKFKTEFKAYDEVISKVILK